MTLQIDCLSLGLFRANCYVVGDSETKEALIIDPTDEHEVILGCIQERGYQVLEIIATHAHFDHVLASYPLKAALKVPFRLHAGEVPLLQNSQQWAQNFGVPSNYPPAEHDGTLAHGDFIQVGAFTLEARFTPGHSPAHLIFVVQGQGMAFVGDCIFRDGFGRTDLPGANALRLKQSILEEILTLPDDTVLLSGHGSQTTVGREKRESQALAYLLGLS